MIAPSLTSALEIYRSVLTDLGLPGPQRLRSGEGPPGVIDVVHEGIEPLRLPADLAELWSEWHLDSFVHLTRQRASLIDPVAASASWPISATPRILIPFVKERDSTLAVELATADHDGGRVFELTTSPGPRVIASSVASLFVSWASVLQSHRFSPVSTADDAFWEPSSVDRAARFGQLDQTGSAFKRPATWPTAWRVAEGITEDHLRPRGATHSVAAFDEARATNAPMNATLRGSFDLKIAGGTLQGAIGELTDPSGSIQLFVPNDVDEYGGPSGPVEVDVVGSPQSGTAASDALPTSMQFDQDPEEYGRHLAELIQAMNELDRSVVATAIRSVDS